ncbi:MAG: heavy metal translocating P-type ATPase metal-binding domain-containing protein [Bacteroidia bacterium]|nr:heavy metal translocating P-type ATPase metal-binding domain-containing protein [Bacteroidia bacterium]
MEVKTIPLPVQAPAATCYHCGNSCEQEPILLADKPFCCEGCKTVYQILHEHDLCTYYDLSAHPGITLRARKDDSAFAYLDNPEIAAQLISFQDETLTRVTFFLPAMHCASCIWLLENLYRLHPAVTQSRVDFLKKEISLTFRHQALSLRGLVNLLATLGYEPEIHLRDLHHAAGKRQDRSFYYKLGVAGFCFGNIMLLSFPEYLGLEKGSEGGFQQFFGYLNILLALPVFLYSASEFFRSAWSGLTHRMLNIDVPISLGILVLFGRSTWEILAGTGPGFMDSLAALVFFLLAGRWFQHKTFDSLSFDRDYTAYFPIAATLIQDSEEKSVPVTSLQAGDTIRIRHQELIPADGILLSGQAAIDYSFVTGEAVPVAKFSGDLLYAGGRQTGASIEMTLTREVSQSYLTQLWNHDAFQKDHRQHWIELTDRLSQRFTVVILGVALVSGLYWLMQGSVSLAAHVSTSVLIVACPCALALIVPITLGSILRHLGHHRLFLKNTGVIEQLAEITHIVFDKTGTLTYKDSSQEVIMVGQPTEDARRLGASLARQSSHPVSRAVASRLGWAGPAAVIEHFEEVAGQGVRAWADGHEISLGRADFAGASLMQEEGPGRGYTWLVIEGETVAGFALPARYRPGLRGLLARLQTAFSLSLLSGDHDRERAALEAFFPADTPMLFNQQPDDKLAYIASLQASGARVLMVGDGLNDAGALRAAQVGVAVSEQVDTFSPACDAILDASQLPRLDQLIRLAQQGMWLVRGGLLISLSYNLVGLSFAVRGLLSPVIAAILMPLSSATVLIWGLAGTWIAARYLRQETPESSL